MTQFSSDLTDEEALAAEFVLGTLDADERARVEQRRASEPAFEAHISEWEQHFASWTVAASEVTPPADLFAKIEAAIAATNLNTAAPDEGLDEGGVASLSATNQNSAANDNLAILNWEIAKWRAAAVGVGALAAIMFVGVGVEQYASLRAPKNFVTVLQKDAYSPAFFVTANFDTRA